MREVSVIGVGMTPFGKFPNRNTRELGAQAIREALKDCTIPREKIQGLYCSNQYSRQAGQPAAFDAGIMGAQTFNCENGCASGSSALWLGWWSVASGFHDAVVVFGMESMTPLMEGLIQLPDSEEIYFGRLGLALPSYFGLLARRHMHKYGTTVEQFAKISVKNHKFGALNPKSRYRKVLTIEEVQSAKMVADPLTTLHCCPIADGGAAAILCASDTARKYSDQPIRIRSCIFETSDYYGGTGDVTDGKMTRKAAGLAYEQAGIGPNDLDVLEVHDCFTNCELLIYEAIGLCRPGEGGRLVDEGATDMGGKWVVCPSGGLQAKGHPIGATGIAQVVEIVEQLRGRSGDRQVPNAKVGLTHNYGGVGAPLHAYGMVGGLDFGNCGIAVFSR